MTLITRPPQGAARQIAAWPVWKLMLSRTVAQLSGAAAATAAAGRAASALLALTPLAKPAAARHTLAGRTPEFLVAEKL